MYCQKGVYMIKLDYKTTCNNKKNKITFVIIIIIIILAKYLVAPYIYCT